GHKLRAQVLKRIRALLDDAGHDEALFPLLIPEDEFMKEAIHVKGFEEEVYWVTHGGLTELNVKLAIRPTSETAIYPMFALWIRSHADLPLRVYQIVNTFRYETKATRPLIRLREITTFTEAHTAHSTYEDAEKQVQTAIEIYKDFFDSLGIPYVVSRRPEWDKFPGADYTMAFDTVLPDGRTLQIGTVHNLGSTFARTFDIMFENPAGEQEYAYQTCYGISDRVIASLLAVHGDDKGLSLMPDVAPFQCVVVPILFKGKEEIVREAVSKAVLHLKGLRVHVDTSESTPGSKFYNWEMKGVPLRVEIGPRDAASSSAVLVRRDSGEKRTVKLSDLRQETNTVLDTITADMKKAAAQEFESWFTDAETLDDAQTVLKERKGVVRTVWCGEKGCGLEIEEVLGATLLGTNGEKPEGNCVNCSGEGKEVLLIARSY
ncbi:MAG TPA: proline--tRNA ligase, partial [Euryarchaeota archaeon]|nr:proline--tRNA ligase [Euryarchaeota archaeon]